MNAELLTIGDELLIGQVVNTNAVWMAKELKAIGVAVSQITSISDHSQSIMNAVDDALKRVDLLIITGGLGPTKDDITKEALCDYFKVGLKKEPSVLAFIKENFLAKQIAFLPVHEDQALILDNSDLIFNDLGTAPGMWINSHSKNIICMPGVPFEMKGMMKKTILPRIVKQFKLPFLYDKTLVFMGMPESDVADKLTQIEDHLPSHIKLAYLPNFGMVRVRVSGIGKDKLKLKHEIDEILYRILQKIPSQNIAASDDKSLEEIIGQLLVAQKQTLAIAESCTGGYISHLITTVPGSSDYFIGSLIAYSYQIKTNLLGVKSKTLREFGAVSEECVKEMVIGIRNKFKSDYAISTTGIAGPDGATSEKPIGMVWIAVAGPHGIKTRKIAANGDRLNVIERSASVAMDMLRRIIVEV